ncbi:uncharacterized protein I206_107228 [Kwoniella pini CBS 10737]|uniref:GH16 domain-containing protein n=1 Tax=Kwoniella pini CBS 10737 TaxID=1296096 RepID=A0A1B9HYU2_9TREE|nr:uncharacterized protein I206_05227 [Kwoniella pini CBS 10737]OCF48449.1 hypothetical protein I206_05227 [Kwoniella pini CBS 10737]
MRSISFSLISILPLIGRALGGTCSAKGASTGTGVVGVAAVATEGTTSSVSSAIVDSTAKVSSSTSNTDTASASSATSSNGNTTSSKDPTISPGSNPNFKFKQPDKEKCDCGYKVSGLGDIYMPFKFEFNFSSLENNEGFKSGDDLKEHGWRINDGKWVGGPNSTGLTEGGQPESISHCIGDPSSLSIKDGNLLLNMKGAQTAAPNQLHCPEIIHDNATLYGIFQSEIQWTDTPGTCQAFWMNHTNPNQFADELDIEVIGGAIMNPNKEGTAPGIWSTNWDPAGDPNSPLPNKEYTGIPHASGENGSGQPTTFSEDPTKDFHTYTIAWVPGTYSPRYMDGKEIGSPNQYNAIHPMEATFNNWSNGAKGWSAGPPIEDSIMKVRSVLFYYRTEEVQSLPSNCKVEDVCTV